MDALNFTPLETWFAYSADKKKHPTAGGVDAKRALPRREFSPSTLSYRHPFLPITHHTLALTFPLYALPLFQGFRTTCIPRILYVHLVSWQRRPTHQKKHW